MNIHTYERAPPNLFLRFPSYTHRWHDDDCAHTYTFMVKNEFSRFSINKQPQPLYRGKLDPHIRKIRP